MEKSSFIYVVSANVGVSHWIDESMDGHTNDICEPISLPIQQQ